MILEANSIRLFQLDESQFAAIENIPTSKTLSGIAAVKYNQLWEIGQEMLIQIQNEGNIVVEVSGVSGAATVTDVSPVGWQGDTVWNISYTPAIEQIVEFKVGVYDNVGNFITNLYSECIKVQSVLKNCIKIEWHNTENSGGLVYGVNGSIFKGVSYVNGYMINVTPSGVITTMEDSNGEVINLKSVIQKNYNFKAYLLPQWVITHLSIALASDRITINNTDVIFKEPVKAAVINNSNMGEITGEATKTNWAYSTKLKTQTGTVLIAGDGNAIKSNNDIVIKSTN